MNFLVTSAGRRVKLICCLRETLGDKGRVIAVDCDATAPALYAADGYELVPRIDHPDYIDALLEICQRQQIDALFSLIDPELSLLCRHVAAFQQIGVQVVVSPADAVEICLDKQATSAFLKQIGLPFIPTYTDWEDISTALMHGNLSLPVLIKPRCGSASQGIAIAESFDALEHLFQTGNDLVVQPYLQAAEYGVDAYVDLISGELISVFAKRKLRMRAGETDRSQAIHEEALFSLLQQLIRSLPLRGPIDIDCFKCGDQFVISEINPRFGGGYLHAYLCGENYFSFMLANLQGTANTPRIGTYPQGSILLKYDEVRLI
ncbi:ATP-grasp domain-containing protein [Brevibacillus fulvus]|uniref:Carbamoyl-phosphate synthase large subunit n=1 Tax=Brevibacillus fulvus TaxID=1125967 RepID=A0A938XRH2_9BACL|nr:ATP-grasp domain-containing protein [Brevibacillus fulvus]MBM7588908.1 carbamoyl-phosphate synthase large subunit [Brevibacillus fulvus]